MMDDNPNIPGAGAESGSSNSRNQSVVVQADDVLYGKGKDVFNHPGNSRFREIILTHTDAYLACKNSNDRLTLVQRVVELIESRNGGRFLRKNHVINSWVPMNYRKIQDKILNTFRDAGKKVTSSSTTVIGQSLFDNVKEMYQNNDSALSMKNSFSSSMKRKRPDDCSYSSNDNRDSKLNYRHVHNKNHITAGEEEIFKKCHTSQLNLSGDDCNKYYKKVDDTAFDGFDKPKNKTRDAPNSPVLSNQKVMDRSISSQSDLDSVNNNLVYNPNVLQPVQVMAGPVAVLYVPPVNNASTIQQPPILLNLSPVFSESLATSMYHDISTLDLFHDQSHDQSLLQNLQKKSIRSSSSSMNVPVTSEIIEKQWDMFNASKLMEQASFQFSKASTKPLADSYVLDSNLCCGAKRLQEALRRRDSCSSEED